MYNPTINSSHTSHFTKYLTNFDLSIEMHAASEDHFFLIYARMKVKYIYHETKSEYVWKDNGATRPVYSQNNLFRIPILVSADEYSNIFE